MTNAPFPPPDAASTGSLHELVERLTSRFQSGQVVDLAAEIEAHPQHAERLRQVFPALEIFAQLRSASSNGVDAGGAAASADRASAVIEGELGDFRIMREVGRGGMGVVFEAQQISLGRRVALKVLPFAGVLDARQLQRFKNEARAAAGLHYSGIVPVYAVGCERGVHFYAMQFIEGHTLADVIQELRAQARGRWQSPGHVGGVKEVEKVAEVKGVNDALPPFPRGLASPSPPAPSTLRLFNSSTISTPATSRERFRTIAEWGIQIAEALDYAHSVGVIHRDIKPANLMLDAEGGVWITDFGLAQIETDAGLTMTGDILGTLRYMSPEQALGQRGLVDQRTDVYSLGMTLYELLILQPAFPENDRRELLQQIANDDPAPLRRIDRIIPVELETIVLKALDKEPAARYATAQQLADDLRRFLAEQPIRARPPTKANRIRKWARRNPLLVKASFAFAFLLAICVIVAASLIDRERQQTRFEQKLSEAAKREQRLQRYVTNINLAERDWQAGKFAAARNWLSACLPRDGEEDIRGFEWHLLWQAARGKDGAIGNHQGSAYCSALSPDGRILVTGGQDGARVWDLESGGQLRHLTEHSSDVNGVALSPAGDLLATASDDRSVKIWHTADWQVERALPHTGMVVGCAFTPDGRLLATGERNFTAADGTPAVSSLVRLWNTGSWRPLRELDQMKNESFESLAISQDGAYLAAATGAAAYLWDLNTCDLLGRVEGEPQAAGWVTFAQQHPWLALTTQLWEIPGLTRVMRCGSGERLSCAAFSRDDSLVAMGGRIWKYRGDGVYAFYRELQAGSGFWSEIFAADDSLITTSQAGAVQRWNMRDPPHRLRFRVPQDHNPDFAFAPSGDSIAITTRPAELCSLDGRWKRSPLSDTWPSIEKPHLEDPARRIAIAPGGREIVALRASGWANLHEAGANKPQWHVPIRHDPNNDAEFVKVGQTLLIASGVSFSQVGFGFVPSVEYRDAASGALVAYPAPAAEPRDRLLFNPQGDGCIVIRFGGPLEAWRDGDRIWKVEPTGSQWFNAAFSRDGKRLAICRADGMIHVWNFADGSPERVFLGDLRPFRQIAFTPDGRTLAAEASTVIKFWNVATGRELLAWHTGLANLRKFAFSPAGNALAACGTGLSGDGEIVVWLSRSATGDDSDAAAAPGARQASRP